MGIKEKHGLALMLLKNALQCAPGFGRRLML
jgi:hypothetical protein